PQKLMAEVETSRAKQRKVDVPPVPPAAIAKKDDGARPGAGAGAANSTPKPGAGAAPGSPYAKSVAPPSAPPAPVSTDLAKADAAKAEQARRRLGGAQACLRSGDHVKAQSLVSQVEAMQVKLDRPGDVTVADLRRQIAQSQGLVQTSATQGPA